MFISPSLIFYVILFPQLITAILSCDSSCIDMERLKAIYDNVSFKIMIRPYEVNI